MRVGASHHNARGPQLFHHFTSQAPAQGGEEGWPGGVMAMCNGLPQTVLGVELQGTGGRCARMSCGMQGPSGARAQKRRGQAGRGAP